jgi:hypothetical protein
VLGALDTVEVARSLRPVGPAVAAEPRAFPGLVPPALTDPLTPIASEVVTALAVSGRGEPDDASPDESLASTGLDAWVESQHLALAHASATRAPDLDAQDALGVVTAPEPLASVTPLRSLEPEDDPVQTGADAAPPTVPSRPGDLLVLLGEAAPAYAVARSLAASMRVPVDTVAVVAHEPAVPGLPEDRRIGDVLGARLHGAQLAAARTSGVVVVTAPPSLVVDPLGQGWVTQVVEALGATAVWAVVDATRRTADLRAWIDVLPPVAALAAHGTDVTCTPEAVHHLGVPVAVVDGRIPGAPPAGAPVPVAGDAAPTLRRSS